jgi:hypothetical protein
MDIKQIHQYRWESTAIGTEQDRMDWFIEALNKQEIIDISSGYGFDREIEFEDFCISFNDNPNSKYVVFSSKHNGYIAQDFVSGNITDNNISDILIKKIDEYVENKINKINKYLEPIKKGIKK